MGSAYDERSDRTTLRFLQGFGRLNPRRAFDLIRNPWKMELYLRTPAPVTPRAALQTLLPELAEDRIVEILRETAADPLRDELNLRMRAVRNRDISFLPWHDFLYALVRALQPRTVVETGVFDGVSSAFLLRALDRNGSGHLISIDLPARTVIPDSTDRMSASTLPPGHGPGWVIPETLRDRHQLHLGDSRELLPGLLAQLAPLDLFLHDSLHSADHQSFEYRNAWPALRPDGILASDDILWSPAFDRFCRGQRTRYVRVGGGGGVRRGVPR